MKKTIILSSLLLLSACGGFDKEVEKNRDVKLRTICIEGLSFLSYQGDWGTNFGQIYIPAKNPANPPQPKTCINKAKQPVRN